MRFRLQYASPPGGLYFFTTPKGNHVETRRSLDAIECLAYDALIAEGSPVPPDLRGEVQHQMCQSLPDGFCDGKPTTNNPTFFSILDASMKLAKASSAAGDYGSQTMQDVERRASVCVSCPMHAMNICITCNGLMAAMEGYRINRRMPYDSAIRVCRASSCLLPVQIHAAAKHVIFVSDPPAECWVKKETSNVG